MRFSALLCIALCACDLSLDLATTRSPITVSGAGPAGVTASATVVRQIDVHWSAVDAASKYYVLQSANGGAFQSVASTLAPATAEAVVDLNVGVNAQVSQLALPTGQIASASITAQCMSSGFIFACARIRERGTWDWCSPPVACSGGASAVVPLAAPLAVGTGAHVDIALMSGPTVATSPFGVYTVQ